LPVTSKTRHYLDSVPFVVPLLLLYSTIVAYFILRPLGRAALLADQMSRGETPLVRLPVARPDEIGALTAAFNRLLDRLDVQSQELGEQKELAESAATAKSRFLAAASHDLRQPMHALNLYLGALDQFELPATARPVMASARECAQTMDEMFRALLDISKLDASTLQADLRTFAIAPLLEKIKNSFVQQAQAKGLELRVAPCSAFVASDPELLERVLSNLVSNAVRYTTHGKILLGCRRTAGGLRVGVYDTGPGIAADQQQAVFEEFYQVGNPERQRAQGLGLGLAIVQRLSAVLRAPLVLHSVPGRGSVFSIEVPRAHPYPQALVAASATTVITSAPGRAALAPKGALQGALIVVVDDEALILDATALLLRQWGCEVITAASGAEAIERLSQCARVPDAVVCDHRLRGAETGVDVISALRSEFNCDIPAMLITGDTSPERMQSILITGIPVLNKPLLDHVLRDALLGLVNQKLSIA
jgi:signal transduction histidine kinase